MGRRQKITKELEAAKREFENWRGTRTKRGVIPKHLWGLAISLAEKEGIHRTSKALRINYETLKNKMNGQKDEKQPAFLEVIPSGSLSGGSVIEIETAGGAKMRISLSGRETLDISEFLKTVWETK